MNFKNRDFSLSGCMIVLLYGSMIIGFGIILAMGVSSWLGYGQTSMPALPAPTFVPADLKSVELDTVIVKMNITPNSEPNVLPLDPKKDFKVIELDGKYTVEYQESSCQMDNPRWGYAHLLSVKHCLIFQKDIITAMGSDHKWLDEEFAPFKDNLTCSNGWVYLGEDKNGKQTWFIEMFGFHYYC